MTPIPASVIYPELPDPLTPGDLQQLFSPSFDERQWAPTVVRAAESQVALLVQLKIKDVRNKQNSGCKHKADWSQAAKVILSCFQVR